MQGSANSFQPVLEQLKQPAIIAVDGRIRYVNPAAKQLLLTPESTLEPMLGDFWEDYCSGADRLQLPLQVGPAQFEASVTRWPDGDLLILQDSESESIHLVELLRATGALRSPLQDLIASAEVLFPYLEEQENEFVQAHTATMTRAYYRMVRAIATIGDSSAMRLGDMPLNVEKLELCNFFNDVLETARGFCEELGVELSVQLPAKLFTGMVDAQKLERAVNQLICNALANTPSGGKIEVRLEHVGLRANLRVHDSGRGLGGEQGHGAGFGLVLAREVARLHGGGLMLQSDPNGTTACFSIRLEREAGDKLVRSPVEKYDYAGGPDHAHVEYADVMPDSAYDSRCV